MNDDFGKDLGNRIRDEINEKIQRRMNHHGRMVNSDTLVFGLVLVAVGVILLLAQMGIFDWGVVRHLWPMIFVVIGLGKIFGKSGGWIGGGVMMLLGGLLLMHEFGRSNYGFFQLWPLLLVAGGLELFLKAWSNPTVIDADGVRVTTASEIDTTNIFGGSEINIASKEFRGGKVVAVFGGFQIDLTRAEIAGNFAKIEASAVFGGGEIRVPPQWTVIVKGAGVFGGYSDETQQIPPDPNKPSKTLFIEGAAVFGGVTVKN